MNTTLSEPAVKEEVRRDSRYEVRPERPLEVVLERTTERGVETVTGRVIELSRNGVKLSIAESIPFEEVVRIRIESRELAVAIDAEAKICWGRPGPGSTWLAGCLVTPQIEDDVIHRLAASGCVDRRRAERTAISLETTVQWELQSSASPVLLTDLSSGGFGMTSSQCPSLGQRLLVHVDDPRGVRLSLPAQVEWASKANGGYAVGCYLLNGDQMAHLNAAVKRAQPAAPPEEEAADEHSPWMFTALMIIAFIGPSVAYGLFRALNEPDRPAAVQLAETGEVRLPAVTDSEDAPRPSIEPTVAAVEPIAPAGPEALPEPEPNVEPPAIEQQDAATVAAEPAVSAGPQDNVAPLSWTAQDVPTSADTSALASEEIADVESPSPLDPSPVDVADAETPPFDPPPFVLVPEPSRAAPPVVSPSALQPGAQPRDSEPSVPQQTSATSSAEPSAVPSPEVLLPSPIDVPDVSTAPGVAQQTETNDATRRQPANDLAGARNSRPQLETLPPVGPTPPAPDPEHVQRAAAAFETAYDHYRQGRLERAIASLRAAGEHDPTNALYAYAGALVRHQNGQTAEASRLVERGAELEQARPIPDWGRAMQRFQGHSRVWLEQARAKARARLAL